jgi:hypothetical protein
VSAGIDLRRVVATEHSYPADRFAGRGIVMCAGGARLLTCAWVAINVLRRVVQCELPIQLWHLGPGELSGLEAALFDDLDVEIVDALELSRTYPAPTLGGWELKAYALVHSRFEDVLLLDADNVVAVNPAFLFDDRRFTDTGAIFWPDIVRLTTDNRIWELCGVAYRAEPAWETGQLLINKRRCWHALQIALHMNMRSEVFYAYTNGDKETFHLAWILADAAWAMPTHPARSTTTGLYQRDFEGGVLFQHRSAAKWRLSGQNLRADDFRHETECLRFIDELRERWSGTIDALPAPSARSRENEEAIAAIQWFCLQEPGTEPRLVELLPANRIGVGSSRDCLLRWYVRTGVLHLDGATDELPAMKPGPSGGWASQSSNDGRTIELVPAPRAGLDALGATATAVIERLQQGVISDDDAVTTLSTLSRVGDLRPALERARSRWHGSDEVLHLLERTDRRVGLRNTSCDPDLPGYESIR